MSLVAPAGFVRIAATQASDAQIRAFCARSYLPLAGLNASPALLARYNETVAPDSLEGHGSALQRAMDNGWSCAMTVDGEDRLLLDDLTDEEKAKLAIYHRYLLSMAMTDEQATAIAFKALHMARKGEKPSFGMGDHVIIDAAIMAHTFSLTSDIDADGIFTAIEGGNQTKDGYMSIEASERRLLPSGLLTNRAGTANHDVYCWVSCVELLRNAKVSILIPEIAFSGTADETRIAISGDYKAS